jgi:hypothetical protein
MLLAGEAHDDMDMDGDMHSILIEWVGCSSGSHLIMDGLSSCCW